MSGTVININVGGGGSGSGSGSGGGIPGGRDTGRMIFNDLTSRQLNDTPALDWQLVSSPLLIQNMAWVHTVQNAKTVVVFRPSASNANSGIRFRNDYGMALGLNSYCRSVFKLIDLGSAVENDTHNIAVGWNSTANNSSIGNAGIMLKINAGTVFVEHKAGGLTQTTPTQVFASYDVMLDVEIDYTADDAVTVTVKNVADGTVLHTFEVSGVEIPNHSNQTSGHQTTFQAHFFKTTTGTVDAWAIDYVGFYGG